jgi:hypothetical protein
MAECSCRSVNAHSASSSCCPTQVNLTTPAERFGRVAGGDGDGGIRRRLHDDDRLAAQGRIFLLFARRKEGVEIEEQPLDGVVGR